MLVLVLNRTFDLFGSAVVLTLEASWTQSLIVEPWPLTSGLFWVLLLVEPPEEVDPGSLCGSVCFSEGPDLRNGSENLQQLLSSSLAYFLLFSRFCFSLSDGRRFWFSLMKPVTVAERRRRRRRRSVDLIWLSVRNGASACLWFVSLLKKNRRQKSRNQNDPNSCSCSSCWLTAESIYQDRTEQKRIYCPTVANRSAMEA